MKKGKDIMGAIKTAVKRFKIPVASIALVVALIVLATFGATWGDKSNGEQKNYAESISVKSTCPYDPYDDPSPYIFTMYFMVDGGSYVPDESVSCGSAAQRPENPTKDGYTFVNWYYPNSDNVYDFNTPVIDDITIVAKWSETPKCTVTFNSNGGSAVPPQTILCGQKITKPDDPTQKDYNFETWFTDPTLLQRYDFYAPVNSNLTLYGKWKLYAVRDCTIDSSALVAPTDCEPLYRTGMKVKISFSFESPNTQFSLFSIAERLDDNCGEDAYLQSDGTTWVASPTFLSPDPFFIFLDANKYKDLAYSYTVSVEKTHMVNSTSCDVKGVYATVTGGDDSDIGDKVRIVYEEG
jgi:uncharacterized repeat protein (TIGR02543 family)